MHSAAVVAVAERLYARSSLPQRLRLTGLLGYAVVFGILVGYGHPGLGIGQGFYVPIVLMSLAGDAATGAAAGLAAAALYVAGLLLRVPATWGDVLSLRIAIHLATYVAAGAIVGFFWSRARGMLSESLHVLDHLLELGNRDAGSGALNARGFDAELAGRVELGRPFALLVGELSVAGARRASDDERVLREAIRCLAAELGPDAEVARAGPLQLAVLASVPTLAAAREAAAALERALDRRGFGATFGWALHPAEGADGLSLLRAASERLYARRIVRGEWAPTAVSAELVDELPRPAPAG